MSDDWRPGAASRRCQLTQYANAGDAKESQERTALRRVVMVMPPDVMRAVAAAALLAVVLECTHERRLAPRSRMKTSSAHANAGNAKESQPGTYPLRCVVMPADLTRAVAAAAFLAVVVDRTHARRLAARRRIHRRRQLTQRLEVKQALAQGAASLSI